MMKFRLKNINNYDVYFYVGDPNRCLQLIEQIVYTTGTNITKGVTPYSEG